MKSELFAHAVTLTAGLIGEGDKKLSPARVEKALIANYRIVLSAWDTVKNSSENSMQLTDEQKKSWSEAGAKR